MRLNKLTLTNISYSPLSSVREFPLFFRIIIPNSKSNKKFKLTNTYTKDIVIISSNIIEIVIKVLVNKKASVAVEGYSNSR